MRLSPILLQDKRTPITLLSPSGQGTAIARLGCRRAEVVDAGKPDYVLLPLVLGTQYARDGFCVTWLNLVATVKGCFMDL